ncbi:MAG TPA: sigma-70 family RNA polymerase sigma factor [Thermoanaerobaculia bacterium]|nr:sigma-70 family RNA polymerase sigma factor [Thermoanaerobaculia bacterium]
MDFFAFDDEYVRRLREGDRWTEEHFERYFDVLLRMKLRGRLRPGIDADDVIQDVFMRVMNGLRSGGGVREGSKFGSYVNSICNHVVSERARSDRPSEELNDDFASVDDILADLVTEETKARVRRILDAMPPRDAEVLRAVYLETIDKDEICRRLGIERGYLRVLVFRALEKFKARFVASETESARAPLSR